MTITVPVTRRADFAQAWPIVMGQATVSLVGLVDTITGLLSAALSLQNDPKLQLRIRH